MSPAVKDGKGGQIYVTESGRKRYVRKDRMFVELRTFKELLEPITKIKITQREDDATKCIVYFKGGNNLHLEEVVSKNESSHGALNPAVVS